MNRFPSHRSDFRNPTSAFRRLFLCLLVLSAIRFSQSEICAQRTDPPTELWRPILRTDLDLNGHHIRDAAGNIADGMGSVIFGTTAGTAAEGNDSRILGAGQKSDPLDQFGNTTSDQLASIVATSGLGAMLRTYQPVLDSPYLIPGNAGRDNRTIFLKRDPDNGSIDQVINHVDAELVTGALTPGAMPIVNDSADGVTWRHTRTTDIEGQITDAQAALTNKPPANLAATTNISSLSGCQTIDGVTLNPCTGIIVLCTGQTANGGAENGPWVMSSSGWARPDWYASGSTTQAFPGVLLRVRSGTTYKGSTWSLIIPTSGTITIDTDGTSWQQLKHTVSSLDVTADITTDDATTGHHGLLPKLSGTPSTFLDGSGAWSVPAGGGTAAAGSPLFSSTADGTNNASSSDTSITGTGVGSKTTAANYFSAGTSLIMIAKGTVSTAVTPDNLTVKIKAGSTTIASATGVGLTGALSSSNWELAALVTCRTTGVSGTFRCNALFAVTGSALTPLEAKIIDAGNTVDTTGTLAWDLTAAWASTTAGDTITGTNFIMYTPDSGATVNDTAYASSWNGMTTSAPSKNAVYDALHAFDADDDGKVDVLDVGAGIVSTNSSGVPAVVGIGAGLDFTSPTLSSTGFTSANAPTGVIFTTSIASVNLKTAGTTDIFTVPSGKTFVCQRAEAVVTAVTSGGSGVEIFKIVESGGGSAMTPNTTSATVNPPLVGYVYIQVATAATSPTVVCTTGNKVQVTVSTSQAGSTAVTGTVYVTGYYY